MILELRTLLVLGRISNLPTVWSNLIVGWALGEGDLAAFGALGLLLAGGSFLYVGGMYLNDFCDSAFDARYCPDRPIPAGKISRPVVGWLAILCFVAGLACLALCGMAAMIMALLLTAAIVLYDFRHKDVVWAPWVMGFCRVLLYLTGIAAARGWEAFWYARWLWPEYLLAMTLGLYVVGLTLFARGESRPGKSARWTVGLLLFPVLVEVILRLFYPSPVPLSAILEMPGYFVLNGTVFYCVLFLGWLAWLLVPYWRKTKTSMRRLVSGLLAGIVLVDMIAFAQVPGTLAPLLFPLFLLALALQRFIPAT